MMSANIPFYVLETQKSVKLQKICPSWEGLLDFQDLGGGFDKGRGKLRGEWGLRSPSELWEILILGTNSQLPSLTNKKKQ